MNDEKRRKATLEVISFSALANVPIFYIILTFKESQRLCNKWKICLYYQIGEVCCMVNWLENRLWNLPICLLCHLEQCDCVFVCVSVCVCVCVCACGGGGGGMVYGVSVERVEGTERERDRWCEDSGLNPFSSTCSGKVLTCPTLTENKESRFLTSVLSF